MVEFTRFSFAAPLAALLLVGCAGDPGRYPSLATRDAERAVGQFAPASPTQPAPSNSADRASIGAALDQARSSHAQFLEDQPIALGLAQAVVSASDTSDARSRALIALAGLTSLRGRTVGALADLDQMEAEAASELRAADKIRTAQTYVKGLVSEQTVMLDVVAQEMAK